jgi:hypothetical protein
VRGDKAIIAAAAAAAKLVLVLGGWSVMIMMMMNGVLDAHSYIYQTHTPTHLDSS